MSGLPGSIHSTIELMREVLATLPRDESGARSVSAYFHVGDGTTAVLTVSDDELDETNGPRS